MARFILEKQLARLAACLYHPRRPGHPELVALVTIRNMFWLPGHVKGIGNPGPDVKQYSFLKKCLLAGSCRP